GDLRGGWVAEFVRAGEGFAPPRYFLREGRVVGVGGGGVKITGEPGEGFREYERWINSLREPDAIAAARFIESPMVHPSVVMRREVVEAVGGYRDVGWAEDYDLWLRMLERGCRFAKVGEVLLEWRDGAERLTRSDERYSQENFLRAKAHFLGRMEAVRGRGVAIAGAGPIGKRLGGYLRDEGARVELFYDVHPRRIGERIGGVPVRDSEELAGPGGAILLGAVGIRGERETVRSVAVGAGYVEGVDFFCVA
ncbi:MAG: glycosyl transferase, partial [Verrucomicrobiota bacterium]